MAASKPVSETRLVSITYGLVAETDPYPEDCQMWMTKENKSWTAFQAHFIKAKAYLREWKYTSCQSSYVYNNLVGIEEYFANPVKSTA